MPKRGDRAAPPPARGEWDLVFADNGAAKGWEQLAAQAPGSLREAWLLLRADPREAAPQNRMHRLKADFESRVVAGQVYQQWQYEMTGGGRIWYCIDDRRHILYIIYAGPGHPAHTD